MRHLFSALSSVFGQTTPTVLKYPIYYSSFVRKNKEEIVNFFKFYNIF